MPANACNTTSHQMLSTHSHTDISTSVFITVDAPVSVTTQSEGKTQMCCAVSGPCLSSVCVLAWLWGDWFPVLFTWVCSGARNLSTVSSLNPADSDSLVQSQLG